MAYGKKNGGLCQDFSDPKAVNYTSAPFATSWSNNRPLAKSQGVVESPGGDLSPYKLSGTGEHGKHGEVGKRGK